MKEMMFIGTLLGVLTLHGCIQNDVLNNNAHYVIESETSINEIEIPNSASYETEIPNSISHLNVLEVGTDENDTLNSTGHVIEIKLDIGIIETLELDKQYLLNSNGKTCLLEISTQKRSNQFSVVEVIINEKSSEIKHNYDVIETMICYVDLNGEYRFGLCGKRGNDSKLIEIYKITEAGVEKENEILGEIESIFDDGEIRVQSRQFLVGFQTLTTIYKVSNDGQMIQVEEVKINNDTFSVINSIEAKIYDSDINDYREIEIPEGERLTFYKTNMKDKLYFKRDNGDEGYIEIIFIDTYEGFSVNGIDLVDYFDGSELSWAG